VKRNGLFRVRVLQPHRLAAVGVARCGAATLRAGGVCASAPTAHGCRLRGCAAALKAIRLREPEAGGKRGAKGLHFHSSRTQRLQDTLRRARAKRARPPERVERRNRPAIQVDLQNEGHIGQGGTRRGQIRASSRALRRRARAGWL